MTEPSAPSTDPTRVKKRAPKAPNGEGGIRELPSDKFQVRVVCPDGVRRSFGVFDNKTAARERLREVLHEMRAGSLVGYDKRRMPLQTYIEQEYRKRRSVRASTAELYDDLIRLHVIGVVGHPSIPLPSPRIGQMPLEEISVGVLEKWRNDRLAVTGPARVRQAYVVLSAIFKMAVNSGELAVTPCRIKGASTPAKPERREYVSEAEAQAMITALPSYLRVPTMVALGAHLRRGELLGLRRGDFDPRRGTVKIERQRRRLAGQLVVTEPKTERSKRTLTLPPPIAEAVRQYLRARPLGDAADPLFVNPRSGQGLTDAQLRCWWPRATRAVGRPDVRFHDLRATGLTWLHVAGLPVPEIMDRAGHGSYDLFLRYQRPRSDADVLAADLLGEAWSGAVVSGNDEGHAAEM